MSRPSFVVLGKLHFLRTENELLLDRLIHEPEHAPHGQFRSYHDRHAAEPAQYDPNSAPAELRTLSLRRLGTYTRHRLGRLICRLYKVYAKRSRPPQQPDL
jgi:hypothetical protein